ncbi:prolyl oligopeptidase family serine peptidase [Brevundimonas sp.]|uniref:prolyl oligopeptidase family serine peptidase n=1 Tax=Brevundimonas sp. TaxID=1871086 RepID=UPI001A2AA6C1|nr:prolyl oligopeptidase family serine peptidase [Brevundimonas sp.]MBJ7485613.1 S9 family peptidase [Brevundimonas sp.]
MRSVTKAILSIAAISCLATSALAQSRPPHMPTDLSPAGVRAADDHLALEEVEGTEAMAFVASENEKSLATLTGDPRYETFRQQAFDILSATDRTPSPTFLGDGIGNFWQDAEHPKGIWRRTTLASYRTATPEWETLLDIDALSAAEGRDWVWKGAQCLAPQETRCLISLSDGGKDAVVVREFDTVAKGFVTNNGFVLPEGKHRIAWLDRGTILVATDFGLEDGKPTLTESGYPFIVKGLRRGGTLADAGEMFRGAATDGGYGVSPAVYRDGEGNILGVLVNRPLDTYRAETWMLDGSNMIKLVLPERISIRGMIDKRLVFTLDEDWTRREGQKRTAGSLMAVTLNTLRPPTRTGDLFISTEADVVFTPNARQSIEDVAVTDEKIVVVVNDNVKGRIIAFNNNATRPWTSTILPAADNAAVHLGDVARKTGRVFYTFEGFLTPSTLALADLTAATADRIKVSPARFDASKHVVEQFEATSTDGTKVPYFLVRPIAAPMDGSTPTILFGYGGFQIAFPPAYKPEMGRLWLENGGAFVIANIRGGGEFGPAWHQAALKENRQRAFDDFAAVARDLSARRITSPRRLGIYGRSNGGVLTSVSITQHPEFYNAAVIESPLIDMLRYPDLPAGASWIGEYGDPRIPEEAAYIARYSGYQNLREGARYPRLYITTNTRDDRVHPGHARKFAARLGQMGYDHLYYEETSGGHSNDADPVANARRWARHYVYLSQQLMD